jgi:hypothetical protein
MAHIKPLLIHFLCLRVEKKLTLYPVLSSFGKSAAFVGKQLFGEAASGYL